MKTFALAEQAQVALEGESGSGKTTFLHLIAGILKPDAGRIVLAGQEMSALNEPARDRLRATTIGYIFQTFNLLQGYTCLENVLLGMSFGPGADRTSGGKTPEARRPGPAAGTLSPAALQRPAAAGRRRAGPGQSTQAGVGG